MIRTIVVVLPLLLTTGLAGASEIPQTFLDGDYAQCHSACSQARDESKCATYWCVTDTMRSDFTLEEYMPMATAMAAGQQADSNSVAKLGGITTTCVREAFQ